MTGRDWRGLAPWTGLFLGAGAWAVHHQAASDAIFWDCRLGGPMLTGGLGLVCGLVAALGGVVSWRARNTAAGGGLIENRQVSGMIGAGAAGVFLLAILFQSLTGFIIPACHR